MGVRSRRLSRSPPVYRSHPRPALVIILLEKVNERMNSLAQPQVFMLQLLLPEFILVVGNMIWQA